MVNGWLDLRNICMEIPNFEEDASNTGDSVLKNGLKALGSRFCENTVPYDQRVKSYLILMCLIIFVVAELVVVVSIV